ncbi:MAG: twin-arginine translocation signal domain-containing protein, partial [Anaerolineae bacterium]|nr:twin-arginine translocation signal domain-containing protein [Anaerolineae bacterium]
MKTKQSEQSAKKEFTRRDFLKLSGVTGAAAFLGSMPKARKAIKEVMTAGEGNFFEAK